VSVHKEGDVWIVRKRIDGHQRKFRSSIHGFPNTKRGAEKFEAGLITEIEKGTYRSPDGTTVAEYAERWFKVHTQRSTTPKTQQSVRSILDTHIIPGLGAKHLSKLKPIDIEDFYGGLKRGDGRPGELSAGSRSAIHRVLNALLNHAVEMEVIARNPIKRKSAPKPGHPKRDFYDTEQAKQILALSEGTRFHTVLALAIHTGMRIGEISALRWTDVDLDAQTITIQRSMEQTRHGIREKGTKTGKGRTIEIGDWLTEVLRRHRGEQAQRRLQGSLPEYVGHVITYENGAPNAPYNLALKWNLFIKGTDLPYYSFHTLRHTHVSLLIAQGEQAKEISVRVGHSSITLTMDTYGHLMKGSGAHLAKRLDAALGT
jgi:integrase